MNLNELAKEAHHIAVEHGWWSPEPSFGEDVYKRQVQTAEHPGEEEQVSLNDL